MSFCEFATPAGCERTPFAIKGTLTYVEWCVHTGGIMGVQDVFGEDGKLKVVMIMGLSTGEDVLTTQGLF